MFSSRHCPRSDFSPAKPDPRPHRYLGPVAHISSPFSKGKATPSPPRFPLQQGLRSLLFLPKAQCDWGWDFQHYYNTSQYKRKFKKRVKLFWAGPAFSCLRLLSHPEPKTCTAALFHKAHRKPAVLCYKTSESQPPGPAQSQGKEKGVGFELSQKDSWLRNFSQEARLLLFPPSAPNTSPRLRIRLQKRAQLS